MIARLLIDKPAGSARVVRVYRPTEPHRNTASDEFLYVLSGRGTFWAETESNKVEFGAGDLLCFDRDVVHAMSDVLAGPLVFLAVDAPGRAVAAERWLRRTEPARPGALPLDPARDGVPGPVCWRISGDGF